MKTAISLPDRLYEAAEEAALSLGLPRSKLYALALEEFLARHSHEAVTERLNKVYPPSSHNEPVTIAPGLEALRELTIYDSW